jgi:hypothetical protein
MKKVLGDARANVCIYDKETNELLFTDSNLFVDIGRALIADTFSGTIVLNPTYFACDFGDNAAAPTVDDADLYGYPCAAGGTINLANAPGYPVPFAGNPTGVHFKFEYTAAIDTTIRELGLFYRPDPDITDSYPARHSVTGDQGYLVARLKTTYSSIFIGTGKTITVDWKIIF